MSQRSKEDVSSSWVDPAILSTTSIFSREGSVESVFLDVGPFSDWDVLTLEEDERICN